MKRVFLIVWFALASSGAFAEEPAPATPPDREMDVVFYSPFVNASLLFVFDRPEIYVYSTGTQGSQTEIFEHEKT